MFFVAFYYEICEPTIHIVAQRLKYPGKYTLYRWDLNHTLPMISARIMGISLLPIFKVVILKLTIEIVNFRITTNVSDK